MIELKAHCKINLGLRVIGRRTDGFHDIETVMMPLEGLYDTVSVAAMPSAATFVSLTPLPYPAPRPVFPTESVLEVSGPVEVDCPTEQNIVMRALRLMQHEFGIGEALIRLKKAIPAGAGLGGGSADAAAVLRAVNKEFALELPYDRLEELAARLGSDVPFFVRGETRLCTGRGEIMTPVQVDLSGRWLVVAKPAATVSTAEAYAGITPCKEGISIAETVKRPLGEWRDMLRNDFENSVFARYPEIERIKKSFYESGALYASMSGSGSAVFAIFERRPDWPERAAAGRHDLFVHVEQL